MKKIIGILGLLLLVNTAYADKNPALIDMDSAPVSPSPAALEEESYMEWIEPIYEWAGGNPYSAFTPLVFEWYREEKDRGLPSEVFEDPGKVFVNVNRPLQQTIELEDAGEIEVGNTVGAEVYAQMDGTVDEALEAMVFRWGKPVGATEGKTYPPGGAFARRVEYFSPISNWGDGAYANLSLRRDGGIVKDLADRYLFLVKGDSQKGYDVVMQYLKSGGKTPTQQCFAIAIIRPEAPGKVSYKISTRFQGQSYKVLGNVSIGRKNIGFNVEKVRAIQVEYMGMLDELKKTGTIQDKPTDIGYDGK
ncbi:MAG: hypothetical protein M9962_01300 [Oligoflexia bacterium]|nr:hypothetical protein [Oligoflexia bacterium]